MRSKEELENEIMEAGKDILSSEWFLKGFEQPHHFGSNVSDHELHVAFVSLKIAGLFRNADRRALIRACLCHDMGLIGNRKAVYTTGRMCITQHPLDSAKRAEEILGALTDIERDIIVNHMFPLVLNPPKTGEGALICVADKICAIFDPIMIGRRSARFRERMNISVRA